MKVTFISRGESFGSAGGQNGTPTYLHSHPRRGAGGLGGLILGSTSHASSVLETHSLTHIYKHTDVAIRRQQAINRRLRRVT